MSSDASDFAVGVVLLSQMDGEDECVLQYASKALLKVEPNYMMEKEAYAIMWACKAFWHYLLNVHFPVYTAGH